MSEIAVIIKYKTYENEDRQIVLDTVNDVNVTASSDLTTHPVPSGDIIADHLIKQPCSMSISGAISLNGGQALVVDKAGPRLANVQQMFEDIKNNGYRCEIYKISTLSKDIQSLSEIRFLSRSNMVLTNINWTERINSLTFSFNFNQVLVAQVQEYDVDVDDAYLPNINDPATLNFTDTLIDWQQVDTMLIKALFDFELITRDFLDSVAAAGSAGLLAAGVAAGVAIAVSLAVGASIPVVGWIAVGVIAIGAALVTFFKSLFKKTKYKIDTFKHYADDRKNQKEVVRFSNFVGEIHNNIAQLNNNLKVYQPSANEDQECMVSIGGLYYIFNFSKNNTTGVWTCNTTVLDNDGEKDIGIANDLNAEALDDISQCTSQNAFFRAYETGEYVYIMKGAQNEDFDASNLQHYFIMVSNIDMNKYSDTLYSIIKNALTY